MEEEQGNGLMKLPKPQFGLQRIFVGHIDNYGNIKTTLNYPISRKINRRQNKY